MTLYEEAKFWRLVEIQRDDFPNFQSRGLVLGHLQLLDAAIPHFLCPVGLIFLWVISQDNNPFITDDTKANAWLKLKNSIEILNILAPTSFVPARLSQKLTDYMEHLKEEAHCPPMMSTNYSNTKKSTKRPFSEIMAQKLQKPTVSNFLYSQYSSPDGNGNDLNDVHRADEKLKSLDINNISDIMSIVDSFQSASPEQKLNLPSQTAIPNRDSFPINSLDAQARPYGPAPCPNFQLQDLFPCPSETPLNPPPNWNSGNGLSPSGGNQAVPTNEHSSTLWSSSIPPVDGFVNYSSPLIGGGGTFDLPSTHLQPSMTTSPSSLTMQGIMHVQKSVEEFAATTSWKPWKFCI